jgi:hypothetical protein
MNNISPDSRQIGEITVLNLNVLYYLANSSVFWRDSGLKELSDINRDKVSRKLPGRKDCYLIAIELNKLPDITG